MNMKKMIAAAAVAASAIVANAASVTIDSVVQRWPWNNKVDITYTVTDGQTLASDGGGVFYRLVFNYDIGGVTGTIDGVHDIGASANTGTHTITWTPPADLKLKSSNCTMTATLYRADDPSGDDYMIVNLDTGVVSYEGLLYSQELSNERYNIDKYKKFLLPLRKIQKGTYFTSAGNMTTDKDYYIALFQLTGYQYLCIYYGAEMSESGYAGRSDGCNPRLLKYNNDMRGSADPTVVPVGNANGKTIPRLNAKTGLTFDIPTALMHEIATRAGTTTTYFWGDDAGLGSQYAVCSGVSGITAVGSMKPNNWGLYDMVGLKWQWCLDVANGTRDPDDYVFTPATGDNANRVVRGCANGDPAASMKSNYSSMLHSSNSSCASRLAYIVK